MDLSQVESARLDGIQLVVAELTADGLLPPESIMILGAEARDILHRAHGHQFDLRRTSDLDIGLAIDRWDQHDEVVSRFPRTGQTGIRYTISGIPVDIMPFGQVEHPRGEVTPGNRPNDPFSVFAFREVFAKSVPLALPDGRSVRIPSAAGYGALKVRAWRDRWTGRSDSKDAADVATVAHWYFEDDDVSDRLYETEDGVEILVLAGLDYPLAALSLLGRDISQLIGSTRASELSTLWAEMDLNQLARSFGHSALPHWPEDRGRRLEFLQSLTAGLAHPL